MRRTCRYLFLGAAFLVLTSFHTAAQEAETSPCRSTAAGPAAPDFEASHAE